MWRSRHTCCLSFVFFLTSCSTEFSPKPCAVDNDCGTGSVCELRENNPVCVNTEDATIRIGQSAPVTGTNQALGTNMKLGIELAIAEQNAAGGIRGRMVELAFRDDGYDPPLAEMAARALTDAQELQTAPKCPSSTAMIAGNAPVQPERGLARGPDAVLALIGNVGTPTMVRSAPIAVETGTIFFGAFTGAATVLRNTASGECAKYIFNYRASYAQEAYATLEYFRKKGVADYEHLISFDQNDSFGQAGYDGLVAAYKTQIGEFPVGTDPVTPITRFRYTRNDDTSVPAQVALATAHVTQILTDNPTGIQHVGILMTDTYGAGGEFIRGVRNWQHDGLQPTLDKANRLKFYFSNVSFVGPNALAEKLAGFVPASPPNGGAPYTDSVVVSQVVPNYQNDLSDVVVSYNQLISARGVAPGFTSLEGYIAGRVFIAGLEAHEGPFTPDGLIESFENLPDLGLGIGATAGFSAEKHQYSNSVWGTIINPDGSFRNLYFWREGVPIQFFE